VATLSILSFNDRPLPYLIGYVLVLVILCFWPFNFMQINQIAWNPDGGLMFTPPSTAYTDQPPAKLVGLRQWTIVLEFKTLPPLRVGRILSYSGDEHNFNLSIDQFWDDIILRVRTGKDGRSRELGIAKVADPANERRVSLALEYDGQTISAYLDGRRKALQRIGLIDYSSWDTSSPLILGSQPNGENGWYGVIYKLAVVGRTVRPDELENIPTTIPVTLLYAFDERTGMATRDQSAVNRTSLSWPERFIPYARTILQSPRDYWPKYGRPSPSDIIANVLIYIPIGYLVAAWLCRRGGRWIGIAVPIFTGSGLSLIIEIVQAYLPSRYSSTVDVMTNTAGTIIGLYLLKSGWVNALMKHFNLSFK
jgi:VanZ family protein